MCTEDARLRQKSCRSCRVGDETPSKRYDGRWKHHASAVGLSSCPFDDGVPRPLTQSETVAVRAVERGGPVLVDARHVVDEFQSMFWRHDETMLTRCSRTHQVEPMELPGTLTITACPRRLTRVPN